MRGPAAVVVLALVAASLALVPAALSARSHRFTATYKGHGSGALSGTNASGSVSATGRANVLGRSTLTGSASGVATSTTCVTFSGRAVLHGTSGSIKLAASAAQACAGVGQSNSVGFSGRARVTGGTAKFAGARGTLSFTGTYDRQTGSVTISFTGRVAY